jgi:hypothetical protein
VQDQSEMSRGRDSKPSIAEASSATKRKKRHTEGDQNSQNSPKSSEKTKGTIKPFEIPPKSLEKNQEVKLARSIAKKATVPSPVKGHNFEERGSTLRKTVRIAPKLSVSTQNKDFGAASNASTEKKLHHKFSMLERITEDMEKKAGSPLHHHVPTSKNDLSVEDVRSTSPKAKEKDHNQSSINTMPLPLITTAKEKDHYPSTINTMPLTLIGNNLQGEIPKSNHLKLLIKGFYEGRRSNLSVEDGSARLKPYSNRMGLNNMVKESLFKSGGSTLSTLNPISAGKKKCSRSFRDIEESKLLRDRKLIKVVQVENPELFEKYFKGDLSQISLKLKKKQEEKKGLSTSLTSDIRSYYLKPIYKV